MQVRALSGVPNLSGRDKRQCPLTQRCLLNDSWKPDIIFAPIVQRLERLPYKRLIQGSIPVRSTRFGSVAHVGRGTRFKPLQGSVRPRSLLPYFSQER